MAWPAETQPGPVEPPVMLQPGRGDEAWSGILQPRVLDQHVQSLSRAHHEARQTQGQCHGISLAGSQV